MVTADSQSVSRIVRLALIGLGAAFAWVVISLMLGLGSAQAGAQEGDESGTGAVASLLDRTVAGVTETVGTVAPTATDVVGAVVDVVPDQVQAPVQDVVSTVGEVVAASAEPVQTEVDAGVVSTVVAPVVDLVQQTPIVGELSGGLGLDDAVTDLGATVDRALSGAVSTLTDAGADLAVPPGIDRPVVPLAPGDATAGAAVALVAASTASKSAPQIGPAQAETRGGAAACPPLVAHTAAVSASAASSSALDARTNRSSPGLSPSAISSGSGGAGPGAWALIAIAPLAAHRAWVRRAGPDDDDLPAAPSASTDVSPD